MKETEGVLVMQLSLQLSMLDKVICYSTFSDFMVVGWRISLTQCRTATEVKHGRARSGVVWVTAQVINQ